MSRKVQIEVEVEGKYITLSAPGCAEHIAKIEDPEAVGSHVLELAKKAQPKVNGEPKEEPRPEGERESEPEEAVPDNFFAAVADVASIPEVQQGLKAVGNFFSAISTPRKEE